MLMRLRPSKAHKLLEFLQKKLPLSQPIFNTIKVATVYDADFGDIFTKENTCSLVASVDRHPVTDVQFLNIFWDPDEHNDEEVHDFLLNIPTLKWGDPMYLHNINLSLSDRMNKILASPDLIGGRLEKIRREIDIVEFQPKKSPFAKAFEDLPDDFLYNFKPLHPEKERQIKEAFDNYIKERLPAGFEISVLKKKDLSKAMSAWYQREIDPRKFEECHRKVKVYGIYQKESDGDDVLAAFGFVSNTGLIGGGYTFSGFRRLGLGSLLLSPICAEFLLNNIRVVNTSLKTNMAGLLTLYKMGFTFSTDAYHELYLDDRRLILPFY